MQIKITMQYHCIPTKMAKMEMMIKTLVKTGAAVTLTHGCLDVKLLQSCPILCDPMDCSPPGSSVHGILQARILEWVAMSSSRGSSQPRDRTHLFCSSCTACKFFTAEPLGKPHPWLVGVYTGITTWQYLHTPCNPGIPTLGTYPTEMCIHTHTYVTKRCVS